MKKILVTGGAGYIGSHTCKALKAAGYIPVVYDNLSHGHKDFVKWGPFEYGDISNPEKLDAALKKHNPEAVIHFAAFAYVGESVLDPAKYYKNNLAGTINLLDSMLKNEVGKIIFSSTCATYGCPPGSPICENTSQNPVNPYGRSKYTVEKILEDYDTAYGMKSIVLRYFNAAGADPDGETGEDHTPETHLIPLVLDVALGRKEKVTVMGTDYNTKDGTCVRDYIHVADLASAHVAGLEYLMATNRSSVYNLGNSQGYSVLDIINSAEKVTGQTINRETGKRRPGDPDCLVADAEKIGRELGWKPEYGDIEKIIRDAWKWHQYRFG